MKTSLQDLYLLVTYIIVEVAEEVSSSLTGVWSSSLVVRIFKLVYGCSSRPIWPWDDLITVIV